MFLDARGVLLVNSDHIVTVNRVVCREDDCYISATLSNGETVKLDYEGVHELELSLAPIIPAAPGYSIVTFFEAGEDNEKRWDDGVVLAPIIAWRIMRFSVYAIADDDSERAANMQAYVRPDGRVFDESRDYASVAEFQQEKSKELKAEQEKQLKALQAKQEEKGNDVHSDDGGGAGGAIQTGS